MPELPEVETIRRGLQKRILGKPIANVEVRKEKIVRADAKSFTDELEGRSFISLDRRGKLLIFALDVPERYLLGHLKMTGQLIYEDGQELLAGGHPYPPLGEELPHKYSHVIFQFSDGSRLFFNDMRQFGYLQVANEEKRQQALSVYGPEPLSGQFVFEEFYARLKRRKAPLKAVLLDQKVVAGLGNIYVDEVCFAAGVRPGRPSSSLSRAEAERIFQEIPRVLKEAIEFGGTTFRHFRDETGGKGRYVERLQVYGRGGKTCAVCGEVLLKEKIGGRGTVWCNRCQR